VFIFTDFDILGSTLKPNLGNLENPADWFEIMNYFRGSELQSYFHKILENDLKVQARYNSQILEKNLTVLFLSYCIRVSICTISE